MANRCTHLRSTLALLPLLPILALAAGSCGGKVAEPVRPKEYNATTALGGTAPKCTGEPKMAKPLVVDLDADARIDLEASMKKGVVVVAYDCSSFRVLSNCRLSDLGYDYQGVSMQGEVVQMKGADDVKANLPFSAGKLSGEVSTGRSLDLGLIYVGRKTTVIGKAKKEDLQGDCEGATHFLQRASLGAFTMATGSGAKIEAAAEMFSAGASGKSEASRKAASSAGSLDACKKSDPDSNAPPSECRAPLRVDLAPILGAAALKAEAKPEGKTDKKDMVAEKGGGQKEQAVKATAEEASCPAGMVFADGICTKAGDVAHLCKRHDEADCKEQCGKGSTGSCYNYGLSLHYASLGDEPAKEDPVPYLKKACDGGHADACDVWGSEVRKAAWAKKDKAMEKQAHDLFKKACDMGSGGGCYSVYWANKKENPVVAFKAAVRGCGLGYGSSCGDAAWAYVKGEGTTKDAQKGVDFFAKACASGDESVCNSFAEALHKGEDGFPKDSARAIRISQNLCDNADETYKRIRCENTAQFLYDDQKYDEAVKLAKSTCDKSSGEGCLVLATMMENGKGTKRDVAGAMALYKKICADELNALLDSLRDAPVCPKVAPKAPAKPTPKAPKKK